MINLLKNWKQDQQELRNRFGINKDGKIDQEEWEVARQAAQSEAHQVHDQLALEPDVHIIAKPDNAAQPFIISVYSQALLVQKCRRAAFMALAACAWLVHAYG